MFRNTASLFLFLIWFASPASAQELKCNVEVMFQKLQTTDPKILKTLQTSIFEFMNNRKWTSDQFRVEEKIECSILINVTDELSAGIFRATATIQSSRPIYNSDYNSVLLNYVDREWVFEYNEYQPLLFNENDFLANLTSMLAFYAYIIIGLDYDSYSLYGGTPYYQKAQAIVNTIPPNLGKDVVPGWRAFDSDRNRYWIVDNLLNTRFGPVRESIYLYHRQGFDVMNDNLGNGRQVVLNCLRKIGEVAEQFPNAMLMRLFFSAKSDELVNLFKAAPPNEKANAVQLLYKCDPTNSSNYAKIMK